MGKSAFTGVRRTLEPMAGLRVSALVTNYNYGRFLAAAVESALAQTRPVAEVVVVDDGSTDDSRAVLERLAARHPGVVVPHFQKNAGQEAALNAGAKLCTGDAVAMLDADDLWDRRKVEKVAVAFEADRRVAMVMHRYRLVDCQGQVLADDVTGTLPGGDLSALMVETGGAWVFGATSSLTLRRSALDLILPIPPERWQHCADGALAYPATFLGDVAFLDEALSSYRSHGSNTYLAVGHDSNKVQVDVEATNRYLNQFLARIEREERVDLSRNLQYRRDRFYRHGGGGEAAAVVRLIWSWPLYRGPVERAKFTARFAAKMAAQAFKNRSARPKKT